MSVTPEYKVLQSIALHGKHPVPYSFCFFGEVNRNKEGVLVLEKEKVLDFTSYFNSFSWDK